MERRRGGEQSYQSTTRLQHRGMGQLRNAPHALHSTAARASDAQSLTPHCGRSGAKMSGQRIFLAQTSSPAYLGFSTLLGRKTQSEDIILILSTPPPPPTTTTGQSYNLFASVRSGVDYLHSHDAKLPHAKPRSVHAPALVHRLLKVREEPQHLLLLRDVGRYEALFPFTSGNAGARSARTRSFAVSPKNGLRLRGPDHTGRPWACALQHLLLGLGDG